MSPVIRYCEKSGIPYNILHTGQHYSYEMDQIFFEELELPPPDFNLDIGSGLQGEQTGKMLIGIESFLTEKSPEIVLVQGDTNTVLAGALAASKVDIPVGHVEAGLRSYDREMPEEINRVLADHISTHLYAPTESSRKNLEAEGITSGVFVTGNTVVDALHQNIEISRNKRDPLEQRGLDRGGYFLVTTHRKENVDDTNRLKGVLRALERIALEFEMPVIFPTHPRTRKMMKNFNLDVEGINIIEPVGYLDFLQLEENARLILTDSGGVQEEACVLGVPCVTLRENTERPETLEMRSNTLAGTNPNRILNAVMRMDLIGRNWINPYGDGKAGERIVKIASELLK